MNTAQQQHLNFKAVIVAAQREAQNRSEDELHFKQKTLKYCCKPTSKLQSCCCVWFGSRENPASHPPLLAAPWSVAVSDQLDCCSGVRLKHMLYSLFTPKQELLVQLRLHGYHICGFYAASQGASPVHSFSLPQLH